MKALIDIATLLLSLPLLLAQGDFEKAVSYYKQGQYAKAAEEFEKIVAQSPNYEAGYRVLGDSYLKLRQFEKAARAFRKAVELKGDEYVSHYGLAVALFNQGQYWDTVATLLRAERYARSPKERYQLFQTRGSAYFNLSDFARAVADLQKAVAIQRGEPTDILQLGIALYQLGQYDEAEKYLNQVQALSATSAEAREYLSRIQFQRGIQAIQGGQYRRAVELLKAYTGTQAQDGAGWFNLGLAQLFSEDLAGAEQSFLRAIALMPDSWEAHQRLGYLYEKTQKYSKSLEHYKKALTLHQDPEIRESVERVEERIRRQRRG